MPDPAFKYVAFISYSRDDNRPDKIGKRWADWLESTVENCPIPEDRVGQAAGNGTVPAEMPPVFLDVNSLGVGGKLTPKLEAALDDSEFLLVICSPRSARSGYVAQEVEYFKGLGREDRIIPILVDGGLRASERPTDYLPEPLLIPSASGVLEPPVFVDLRVSEQGGAVLRAGWTDVDFYRRELVDDRLCHPRDVNALVERHRETFNKAKFKLLATLSGVDARALMKEDQRRQRERSNFHRKKAAQAIAVAVLMTILAALAVVFWFSADRAKARAEEARRHAETSLLMIGDAHETGSRLVSDILFDLKPRLDPEVAEKVLPHSWSKVNDYFIANEPNGGDRDSRHMRSVMLNSRAYIYLRGGNHAEAEQTYRESLEIRRVLHHEDPSNPLYLHDLAVSHDNLGDTYMARALQKREEEDDPGTTIDPDFERAVAEYTESLAKTKGLPGDTPQWLHDRVTSYGKLGEALFQAGSMEDAIKLLGEGLPFAEKLYRSELDYAKWRADYGIYCYSLGDKLAQNGKAAEAVTILQKGKAVFDDLERSDRLTGEYRRILREIEDLLETLK